MQANHFRPNRGPVGSDLMRVPGRTDTESVARERETAP
jgi:hypothetical protein